MADTESKPENVEEDIEEISTEQQGQGDATSNQTTFQVPQISSLMQNPEVLAALQDRLGSMIGSPSGYIQSLPKVVKRRIKALKKLQFEMIKIESTFYEEVHALECKYATKYTPLVER
ncbi:Nucleosome assembly protein 1-like 1, partial [Lamellibrachia satsuma]